MSRSGRPGRLVLSISVLVAVASTLTACGGDAQKAGGGSAPGGSSSPSAAPYGDLIDPCQLVPESQWRLLYAREDRGLISTQITVGGSFPTCNTRTGLFGVLSFAFSTDAEAYEEGVSDLDDGTDRPLDLGDRATMVRTSGGDFEAVVEAGGQTFRATYGDPYGVDGIAIGTEGDFISLMETMLDHGVGQVSDEPISLPAGCPDPGSRVVTDLVGTVDWARGGQNPDGVSACGYTGRGGRSINTVYTFLPDDVFDLELQGVGGTVVDPPPGVVETYYGSARNGFQYFALYPDSVPKLELALYFVAGSAGRSGGGDSEQGFLAFVEDYLAKNAPR